MGTIGVPDRYRVPKEGEIVEVQYLYCHPGPEGKPIQAKCFGKVRDDIDLDECSVSQLKVKATGNLSNPDSARWNSSKIPPVQELFSVCV